MPSCLLPHESGTPNAAMIEGMCVYCSRWRLPSKQLPPTFQIMGEPAACWLNRNRAVSRTNLTASLRHDGSVAYADAADAEFEARLSARDAALARPSAALSMRQCVTNTVRSVWSEAALTLVQICGRGVVAGEGTVCKVSCVLGVHQMQKMILRGTHGACRPMRLHRPGPGYRTVP